MDPHPNTNTNPLVGNTIGLVASQKRRCSTNSDPSASYRLHFSCQHCGRYRQKTKRRLLWRFGYTNWLSVREGKQGSECRGEEHEIEILWSVKSGKTRIFWNKKDVSHLFSEEQRYNELRFRWEARSGDIFQIIAHAKPPPVGRQYDFFVGDLSFFDMQHVSEIGNFGEEGEGVEITYEDSVSDVLTEESLDADLPIETEEAEQNVGFRLSMAGLTSSEAKHTYDDLEEDVGIDVFHSPLDTVRHRVTALLPETEDMVSKAVVNAFSWERDSTSTFDSMLSCESSCLSPARIEADFIWETNSWITLNVLYAPRPDVDDQKSTFLQKQIDAVFMHVRSEHLTEDAAIRVLSSVATLLDMELSEPAPQDTILLEELPKKISVDDLIDSLSAYGEVKEAAVCRSRGFGMCRFVNEESLSRAMAATMGGLLFIMGKGCIASPLEKPKRQARPLLCKGVTSVRDLNPDRPSLSRHRSHERNTVTIDTSTKETPFLRLLSDQIELSSSENPTFLKPRAFRNIPARNEPRIFDAKPFSPESRSPTSSMLPP